jgi:hypothetical protein
MSAALEPQTTASAASNDVNFICFLLDFCWPYDDTNFPGQKAKSVDMNCRKMRDTLIECDFFLYGGGGYN